MERGDRDVYNNDKCPKCSAVYCADCGNAPLLPMQPTIMVKCIGCGYSAPVKEFWDAFDKS